MFVVSQRLAHRTPTKRAITGNLFSSSASCKSLFINGVMDIPVSHAHYNDGTQNTGSKHLCCRLQWQAAWFQDWGHHGHIWCLQTEVGNLSVTTRVRICNAPVSVSPVTPVLLLVLLSSAPSSSLWSSVVFYPLWLGSVPWRWSCSGVTQAFLLVYFLVHWSVAVRGLLFYGVIAVLLVWISANTWQRASSLLEAHLAPPGTEGKWQMAGLRLLRIFSRSMSNAVPSPCAVTVHGAPSHNRCRVVETPLPAKSQGRTMDCLFKLLSPCAVVRCILKAGALYPRKAWAGASLCHGLR